MSNNKRSPKNFELLNETGNLITDPVDVGNNFCEYFSSVACKLDENIPRTDTDPLHLCLTRYQRLLLQHRPLLTK